ncbi:xanthine dehydrogenase family protein molybdopterin-binding subunit [Celeribacter indicus]|uniref:Carbon monoxide dehydrogenase n=1 Tax=Celeribacter indicus TaxID=1208324 RepID=A0A0B5E0M4_9RHOB|nr:xanthine dehydrogenase family protein molybdopterin-binding subunit [Celeribacter indicus]AJE49188.1 carbon monoxide dehydrogenase [Celeribacter indicus]SDX18407.1 xanthine dehydrogenase, molybdenum binding subunit apoprotein [Celeribacter indicus]
MKFSPGEANPRHEDDRLLTGHGRYSDDVNLPGQAHAAIVRSPYAHAAINGIDGEAALDMPGVLAVLTGADWVADGLGEVANPGIVMKTPLLRPDGVPFVNPGRRPLPTDRVRYVGEPVAMVVAETAAAAALAAEMVELDLDPLPAATATATARDAEAPLVWEDFPRNEVFVYRAGDADATAKALSAAPRVVTDRLVINRIHANPMEPRSCTGDYDAGRDHYTIYGGVQRSFSFRDMLAREVFRVTPDQVDVVPGDVGGSFGLKGSMNMEMPLVGWASKRLGRPVKWTATRTEMLTGDDHARDVIIEATLAYDDDGRFLGFRAEATSNIGAFAGFFGLAPAILNLGSMAGPYTIPAMHVEAVGVWTHTGPVAPYRGAGRPEAAYVIERMVDQAARDLHMDPVEIRRRNLIPAEALPYRTALTFTYDCGEFEAVLDKAIAAAGYAGFAARRAEAEARGRLRGIGVAMCIETAGSAGYETTELKFAEDGTVRVLAGTTNHGQGHSTLFAQYVSQRLGYDGAEISVVESDTRVIADGVGTGGSRTAAFASAAVEDAIAKAVEKGRGIAANLLQVGPEDLSFAEGVYTVSGAEQHVTFQEVVRAAFSPDMLPAGTEAGFHVFGRSELSGPSFPNGCHVCEVEIDPETGAVEVISHVLVDDVGFEINPMIVKGQLHGGVLQGAGQILMEDMVYDEDGQILTGSFMDYAMPRISDYCSIEAGSHPVPTATNPTGVKGAGESGTVGSMPALANAIDNALAQRGAKLPDMPMTPSRIWTALRDAARGQDAA